MTKENDKALAKAAAEAGVKKEDLQKALKLVSVMGSMEKAEANEKASGVVDNARVAKDKAAAKVPEKAEKAKTSGRGEKPELPKVRKTYTKRTAMLGVCAAFILFGVAMAVIYVFTQDLVMGFIAIPFLFGGGLGFYYYWNQSKDIQVRYQGDVPKEQVNSLVIYPAKIMFENIYNVEKFGGFAWHCIDDGKPYFVLWENPQNKNLEPFNLPDQQYYDPRVFAEKVLTLPCHRKIFQRRQDLMHKLKPFIAAVIGLGLWILIITTTGGNTGV